MIRRIWYGVKRLVRKIFKIDYPDPEVDLEKPKRGYDEGYDQTFR